MLDASLLDKLIPQTQFDITVQIIDRICGAGKTSDMIASLDDIRRYLIVTPLLDDVQDIINRSDVLLTQPEARPELRGSDSFGIAHTKRGHLYDLLTSGDSVVTTHALYNDIAWAAREGLLTGYDIIIDEVPKTSDVLSSGAKNTTGDKINSLVWRNQYLRDGYAEIAANKQVVPTQKWADDVARQENTLSQTLYAQAEAGCLWTSGCTVLVWELSSVLLSVGRSCTVMTYRFKGSLLQAFMQKHGIRHTINEGRETELAEEEARLRAKAKELITLKGIDGIGNMKLTAGAMDPAKLTTAQQTKIVNALKKLRCKELKDAVSGSVLVTCLKGLWFEGGNSDKSRPGPICKVGRKTTGLFSLCRWSANVTRGTNAFSECDTVIYFYDKNLHPGVANTLGVSAQGDFNELYAVSEMVQFIYRSCLRKGEPVTIYMPSARMRGLLQAWLDGDI